MGTRLEVVQVSNRRKLAAIEQAQREGHVSDRRSPSELLAPLMGVSTIWLFSTPGVTELDATQISVQRRTITEEVQLLVESSKRGREEPERCSLFFSVRARCSRSTSQTSSFSIWEKRVDNP